MRTSLRLLVPGLALLVAATLAAGCGGRSRADAPAEPAAPASPAAKTVSAKPTAALVPDTRARRLKETPFERSWDLQLPEPVHTSWISPTLPSLVFFQVANSHAIYAVDAMSGATRWVSPPLPKNIELPAYASRYQSSFANADKAEFDERLWLVSDDILFCLDIATGQLVWRYELPFSPATGPLATGPDGNVRVFLGDHDGRLQVVSLHPQKRFPFMLWQWNLHGTLSAQPTTREDLVYVGTHAGEVQCYQLDRNQVWSFPAGGVINASPIPRGRLLFAGTSQNILFALSRLNGEKLGQLNFNGPLSRPAFFYNDEPNRIYTWIDDKDPAIGGLYAVTAQPDTVAGTDATHRAHEIVRLGTDWHLGGVTTLVASTPQFLYLTVPGSSTVQAVRRDNGQVEWTWDTNEERLAAKNTYAKTHGVTQITAYQDPTDQTRSLFTVDAKGQVIAYRFFGFVPKTASK